MTTGNAKHDPIPGLRAAIEALHKAVGHGSHSDEVDAALAESAGETPEPKTDTEETAPTA